MRLHSVILVVVTVLVASTGTEALTAHPQIVQVNAVAGERVNVQAQRFLRKHNIVDKDDEERGIINALEKAKSLIPLKVTDRTYQRWVADGKSPKHAFMRLNLDNAGKQLFEKPKFMNWVTYMTKLNQKNPEEAIMKTLMTRYTDDVLSQMITAAKSTTSTKDIATKLEVELFRVWAITKRKSADDVFNMFKLNKVEGNSLAKLVDNPQFTTWTKYVDDLSANDAKKANSIKAKTLTTYYTNEGLFNMLNLAKNVGQTKTLATDLQKAQINNWLVDKIPINQVSSWVGAKNTAIGSVERALVQEYRLAYNKMHITSL